MVNLHAHYHLGNVKQFRQELDATASSSSRSGGGGVGSAGKSWNGGGGVEMRSGKTDPNERDSYGRTVLHLAAASTDKAHYPFFTALLKSPNISVNLQDTESGYTALHKAMYMGNIIAARDLILRHDIDVSIKDKEGLTAFDLYNGTVEGTNPPHDVDGSDLFVWGANRNSSLGTGDSSDKLFADRVNLLTQNQASGKPDPMQRFFHIGVKDVVMSKYHTAAITTESRGNLSLCGFGGNGRNIHSQLALTPMPDFPQTITSVALGQDHTLALTSGGYILSWGHNRFSQLGYAIEQPEATPLNRGKEELEVQVSPKRIVGMLKKEFVKGVAAGRMASACWTEDALFTWGTNAGHLGYDKASNPVQVLPRKVPAISQPVLDVALSDYAMICLVDSFEIICFHHDVNFKIAFPVPRSGGFGYRPPHLGNRPMIKKITSSAATFAALSSLGDVFTFTLPNPLEDIAKDIKERHVNVRPQLIWGLRKKFTAAQDVAIGSDGTAIICTTSGHVFVRQRVKAGAGQLKFRRVPYLQRIVKVACSESGAFAAIRVDARAPSIPLKGPTLEEDLFLLQPHSRRFANQMTAEDFDREKAKIKLDEDEEDESANSVSSDIAVALRMCTILGRWRRDDNDSLFSWSESLVGSDIWFVAGDIEIPAHSIMLSLRSLVFKRFLKGEQLSGFTKKSMANGTGIKVASHARHPLTIFLLLQYIYTDEVATVWDARVARAIQERFPDLNLKMADIKSDLKSLADSLELQPLSILLDSASKVSMPRRTLSDNLLAFFSKTYAALPPKASCDTTLVLADKEVACSSILLRARCPFFEAMYEDRDWVAPRQGDEGRVVIHMEHLKWRPMKLVFKYLHGGKEDDLFDYNHQESLDEFLDFVFEVLAAATELLLDRLVLVCSRVVTRHCNAYNATALACEAAFYQAHTLKLSVFDFIIASMETMLESSLLDDMDEHVLRELCHVIDTKQQLRLGAARNGLLINEAVGKWGDWLAWQDIPEPRVRVPHKPRPARAVEHATPVKDNSSKKDKGKDRSRDVHSPISSPHTQPANDDIFTMDEDTGSPLPSVNSGRQTPRSSRPITPLDLRNQSTPLKPGQVPWKSKRVESGRVDLRSIMAETEASKPISSPIPPRPSASRPIAQPTPSSNPLVSPPGSGGPWRQVDASQRPSLSAVQASQAASPPASGSLGRPPLASLAPQGSPAQRGNSSGSKVFTPSKPTSTPNITRLPSGGSAWTAVAGFAPPPPTSLAVSPTTQQLSLLQIQQQEQDYLQRAKKPVMRSFTEILEQEERDRKEAERTAEEIEFDRFLQSEIAKNEGAANGGGRGKGRGGGGGRGQRKVPNRGKAPGPAAGGPPRTPATARIDDEPSASFTNSASNGASGSGGGGGRIRGGGGRGGGASGRGRGGGGTGAGSRGGHVASGNGHGHGAAPATTAALTPTATPFSPSATPFSPNAVPFTPHRA